ncbi:alanine aminotransferase 1 isoform X1 [Danaus plexippus]|uniref:alanine aminotransferase 1 isoform X1 n=2 Tax=Danaus plexippus TaxID=13037 RepID=UPI002AB328C7|nr:alanine aminotransferase 1 isoform X1 [Danaus plexippus]
MSIIIMYHKSSAPAQVARVLDMSMKMVINRAAASRVLSGVVKRLPGETLLKDTATNTRTMASKAVTLENLNPNIIKLEYAVRGPLVIRAGEIEKELEKGASKPFQKVIRANIGDAHAMGQRPITFIRQVLSCITNTDLLEKGDFPDDVKDRAREILCGCGGGSVGSYSASQGIEHIRRHVAEYIAKRDGHPARWQDICLSAGASTAIKNCLQLFCKEIDGKKSGVMIPIPQYPLYSASLAEYGLEQVGYYLDEECNWGLSTQELERSLQEAQQTCNVRALVVINPGNPTGQVLTRENIEQVIKFAHKHKLFIFADEVYQDNVYAEGSAFHSFKKVLVELGAEYSSQELASFMTISKGYMGECGLRGGWVELVNMLPEVQAQLYKCMSAMLCPSVLGQAVVDCVAKPPAPGEPSYDLWIKEKTDILTSLKDRAKLIAETFNTFEGFKCNVVQGAMYAFPRITLPPKAIQAAKEKNMAPDVFYAFRLLEETGVCIVPGSGFGQAPGTFHFRTTILPQPDLLNTMLENFRNFHKKFTQEYA